MKDIFITGLGNISPQKTSDTGDFLSEVISTADVPLKCQDPGYKEFIPADMLRRMSRIIKSGVAAGKICLKDAECLIPDSIITGTGLGCIEDTEKFLTSLIKGKEEFLTPTAFIQSTHNTVSAQIALLLKCHNYNFTFVHRGLSFESALLDSMLRIDSGDTGNVLLGAMDEMTTSTFRILQRLGFYRQKPVNNLHLIETPSRGSIPGEGAAFFLLSGEKGAKNYARIRGLDMLYNLRQDEIESKLHGFLDRNGTSLNDIDLVLLGLNGDKANDAVYHPLVEKLIETKSLGIYKHLCGEYFTSSAFGCWVAAKILYHQVIPPGVAYRNCGEKIISSILLYHHFMNREHAFILLTLP
jgi:3-oxoacyl-[acyl-carrier-protein] synthase II